MTAFSYNNDTGKYIGIVSCQIDPLASRQEEKVIYLLPANSTFVQPPSYDEESEEIFWDGAEWSVKRKETEVSTENAGIVKNVEPNIVRTVANIVNTL